MFQCLYNPSSGLSRPWLFLIDFIYLPIVFIGSGKRIVYQYTQITQLGKLLELWVRFVPAEIQTD